MLNTTHKSLLMAGFCSFAMMTTAFAEDAKDAKKDAHKVEAKADAKKDEHKADAKADDKGAKKKGKKKHHAVRNKAHHDCAAKVQAVEAMKPADSNTVVVSGFVKADFTYDASQFGGDQIDLRNGVYEGVASQSSVAMPTVPARPNANRVGVVNAHGKASRFNITSTQNTSAGALKAVFEGDMMSTNSTPGANPNNTYTLRLRQAHGIFNGFKIGYATSNFSEPLHASFMTVDPNGFLDTLRQPIAVYKYEASDCLSLAGGIERPGTEFTNAMSNSINNAAPTNTQTNNINSMLRVPAWTTNATGTTTADTRYTNANAKDVQPDVTARLDCKMGGHQFSLRGVYRKLTIRNLSQDSDRSTARLTSNRVVTKSGYGIGAGAHLNVMNVGTLTTQLNFGSGIGRYIALLDGQAAVYDASLNRLDTQRAMNCIVAYNHKLTEVFSANLGYGYTRVNTSGLLKQVVGSYGGGATDGFYSTNGAGLGFNVNAVTQIPTKSYSQMFANVMYTPVKNVTVGLEYSRQVRKSISDQTFPERKAVINRVGFGAWYRF
jgi:hypothetical protein